MTAKTTQRTAVLIHGFHLESSLIQDIAQKQRLVRDWRDLAIGRPSDGYAGRATYGVMLAWREQAEAVIFSTGASEKDGLKEAEYTYRAVLRVADDLDMPLGCEAGTLRAWLQPPRVRLDIVSQTTAEELQRNLSWCHQNGYDRVILVTNEFHAPRALATANAVRTKLKLYDMTILASAPEDRSPAPVIFEPSTRPDRSGANWHGTLGKIFTLPPGDQASLFVEIQALIAAHCG